MTYYEDKLGQGGAFEKYVRGVCFDKLNLVLNFTGKEDQLLVGETLQGVEVKFDDIYKSTHNLWIEVAEKTRAELANYTPSGIFRKDNTWIYLIGDYEILFFFGKKVLQRLSTKFDIVENNKKTSRGFLLPDILSKKYAELIIRTDNYERRL